MKRARRKREREFPRAELFASPSVSLRGRGVRGVPGSLGQIGGAGSSSTSTTLLDTLNASDAPALPQSQAPALFPRKSLSLALSAVLAEDSTRIAA